jgi:hypothetical protein
MMNQGILELIDANSTQIEAFNPNPGGPSFTAMRCVFRIRNEGPDRVFVGPETGGEPAFPVEVNKDIIITMNYHRLGIICPTAGSENATTVRYLVTH